MGNINQRKVDKLMAGVDETFDIGELNARLNRLTNRINDIKALGLKKRKTVPKETALELFNIALAAGYVQGRITMIEKIGGNGSQDIDYIG